MTSNSSVVLNTHDQIKIRIKRTFEGNEETTNMLEKIIKKLYKYAYAYKILSKLRQELTGQSSILKNYYGKNNSSKILLNVDTPLGELCVRSVPAISAPNWLVNQAIEELDINLNINIDSINDNFNRKFKYNINVNTDILKIDNNVLNEINEKLQLLNSYSEQYDNEIDNFDLSEYSKQEKYIIKYCMIRKKLFEELITDSQKYIQYYNLFKDTFIKAVKNNYYPKHYEHRGIHIGYENSSSQNFSLQKKIYELYKEDEITFNNINNKIKEIINREGRSTIKILITDYDSDDDYHFVQKGTLL